MTPNLFLATQKAFKPHKWFKSSTTQQRQPRTIEEWTTPVPGRYEHIPGRGWYLIATLKDAPTDATSLETSKGGPVITMETSQTKEYVKLDQPIRVHKSKVLSGRWFLEPEYQARKKRGMVRDIDGTLSEVGFFRLDDGITWVQCWDGEGNFIPGDPKIGGYKRWCIDVKSQQFRPMLKRDDPNFVRSRSNSIERSPDNRSQDSMSTFQRSGPDSMRSGPSAPSTRPNSIRYIASTSASRPPSQRPSRQSSPARNNSIPLEEAKAALRRMAKEQEDAVASPTRNSRKHVERVERGRATQRVAN
ncbi:hypothetical protein IQ07DRAFT_614294 [Pyrenochaeta sp. DS3sAY3a]|nr:hypothetical protein IQ07DRAFT_614294 [Pyrenochaeta sp. DS3sAY3a]